LHAKAIELLENFSSYKIEHIPREENAEADRLANLAMDKEMEKNKA